MSELGARNRLAEQEVGTGAPGEAEDRGVPSGKELEAE